MKVPTPRLRFIERDVFGTSFFDTILQQWWAEDLPEYMRSSLDGEWRDVPVVRPAPEKPPA